VFLYYLRKLPSDYALISDSFHLQLPYEVMKQNHTQHHAATLRCELSLNER
jgi:hypothetical protein